MSDKPSLYVVEKKEVVILVVLFILVTVLAFTMGVKYGESVGRKAGIEANEAAKEHDTTQGEQHGGTLGGEKSEQGEKTEQAKDSHDAAVKAEEHGHEVVPSEKAAPEHGDTQESPAHTEPVPKESKKKVSGDRNSDEYLLSALKEAGVQAPSDKESGVVPKLPENVKAPKAGSFVIQIGSFPTKKDAEQQVKVYRRRKLDVSILPPIKDKQGEWYRVSVGTYTNRNDAERDAKLYKGKGLIKSYFVRRMN